MGSNKFASINAVEKRRPEFYRLGYTQDQLRVEWTKSQGHESEFMQPWSLRVNTRCNYCVVRCDYYA